MLPGLRINWAFKKKYSQRNWNRIRWNKKKFLLIHQKAYFSENSFRNHYLNFLFLMYSCTRAHNFHWYLASECFSFLKNSKRKRKIIIFVLFLTSLKIRFHFECHMNFRFWHNFEITSWKSWYFIKINFNPFFQAKVELK